MGRGITMHSHVEYTEKIIKLLEEHPEGMNIYDLSQTLKCHRNSVSKYLSLLHLDGRVDLHYNGREKIYSRSYRIPFNTLKQINSQPMIGLDKNLDIIDINEPFLKLLNLSHKETVLSQNIQNISFYPFHDPGIVQPIKTALKGKEYSQIIELYVNDRTSYYKLKCIPTIFENKKIGVALLINEDLGKKELEEYIKLLNERYQILSEDREEYVVRFLPDGTITFINEAYCKDLGLPCNDIMGKKFKPIIPGDEKALLKSHFSSLTEDNPVSVIEHRCIFPDGSLRWHRWKDRAIFREGKIVEYRSVGFDITEHKQKEESYIKIQDSLNERIGEKSEEGRKINQELYREILKREKVENALKESESRYRAIVESQVELIFRWKPDGTLTFVNDAGSKYIRIPLESLLGQNFLEFLPEEDQCRVKESIASISPSNPYVVIRHRIVLPAGGTPWQEWSVGAIFDDAGNPIEFQSVGRDITDLIYAKKSQQEPDRCKTILDQAVKDMPVWYQDAIICLDAEGHFTYVSPIVEQMQGFRSDELIGKHISLFMHPEDFAKGTAAFIKTMSGKTNLSEFRVFHKDGSIQNMRTFSYPTIKDGKIVGITAIYGETNDWKSIAETLKRSLSSAYATLEALPHSIIVMDIAGKMVYYNQRFARMWQIPDPILKTNDHDTILDFALDQLASREEFMSKAREKYSTPDTEGPFILKFKDGRTVECHSYPQRTDDQIIGTVLCFKDVAV